ncbi:MAG: preprotein translocase subunit YajC [Lachnospiraceae bacterium]|nr:preprotein translocase subunit YajC [Lachnospiraceae bacterium]
MLLSVLLDSSTTASASNPMSAITMVLWLVILFGIMYFLMIRPQKKEQKKKEAMLNDVGIGDTVLTTSGFYGTIIDIQDDTVIVEFGNNKNCRIPMAKSAIADIEKPEDAVAAAQDVVEDKVETEKKGLFGKKKDAE